MDYSRHCLSILNITPDSFSDGGESFSAQNLITKLEALSKVGATFFDIGAESTAPFNPSIGIDEEISRFKEIFFEAFDRSEILSKAKFLSFDTYKIETITFVLSELSKRKFSGTVIWNDVSGKLDDPAIELLRENENVTYVLCHNLCPDRSKSGQHMDYANDELPVVEHVRHFFETSLEKVDFLKRRIVLDPCFGFSKNYQQNWQLIQDIDKVFIGIPDSIPALIGISRKSFLRKMVEGWGDDDSKVGVESLHSLVLGDMCKKLKRTLYLRVHDPKVYQATQVLNRLNTIH